MLPEGIVYRGRADKVATGIIAPSPSSRSQMILAATVIAYPDWHVISVRRPGLKMPCHCFPLPCAPDLYGFGFSCQHAHLAAPTQPPIYKFLPAGTAMFYTCLPSGQVWHTADLQQSLAMKTWLEHLHRHLLMRFFFPNISVPLTLKCDVSWI